MVSSFLTESLQKRFCFLEITVKEFVYSWIGDEAESTGELIRLGDTAHTFSLRSNGE